MQIVNIHHAKTHFSKLIEVVSSGEEVTIAKAGKAVAKLVAIDKNEHVIKLGVLKGKLKIADDFDAPLPENILLGFEGKSE